MKKQTTSQQLYDNLAPFYGEYCLKRDKYLMAVETLIVRNIEGGDTMMDIGSGDGKRAERIARKLKVKKLLLTDNSRQMVKKLNNIKSKIVSVKHADITKKDFSGVKFKPKMITCLFNVLGHIETVREREQALKNIRSLVDKKGVIFMDVNNRYNAENYGYVNVLINIFKDLWYPSERNGNFKFTIKVKEKRIPAAVHLFNPLEIERLFKSCGLKIIKKFYINYRTGELESTFLSGQILYKLSSRYD